MFNYHQGLVQYAYLRLEYQVAQSHVTATDNYT
jgi:hypothetical protein